MHLSPGPHVDNSATTFVAISRHATSISVLLLDQNHHVSSAHAMAHVHEDRWSVTIPNVTYGQRYMLQADGPWQPSEGHRFHGDRWILDPYATGIEGTMTWGRHCFAHEVDDQWKSSDNLASEKSSVSNQGQIPVGVVCHRPIAQRFSGKPWAEQVIYEAHLKGLSQTHPDVPCDIAGTYAGAAHPAVVQHLNDLGVTAVEFLPLHAIGNEPHLAATGRTNYWGYSTLSYFAPEPRYATEEARNQGPEAVANEVRTMIDTFHENGIAVYLDVVYNHTAEGGIQGPSHSLRGLDSKLYYRLNESGYDVDVTGCGGTVDFSEQAVIDLTLDSLRHWVTSYGVDGFRFDLAPALGRNGRGYSPKHPFFDQIAADPVLSTVDLIAEPWDIGMGGWQTGNFPAPFKEWNDRFRDDVRHFWLEGRQTPRHRAGIHDLATRLAGSADLFQNHDSPTSCRGPLASVNFVTAHDGFTMTDLTRFQAKRNHENGENNRDGSDHNRSWNHGHEGPSQVPAVETARLRSARAMLGTLMLSRGVPMLLAGDEFGNSQQGNNNPYCVDSPTSWLDWSWLAEPTAIGRELFDTTKRLIQLRRLCFSEYHSFFQPPESEELETTPAISWFSLDGNPMDSQDWDDPNLQTLQMLLCGSDQPGMVCINGSDQDVSFKVVGTETSSWVIAWDSYFPVAATGKHRVRGNSRMMVPRGSIRMLVSGDSPVAKNFH